LFFCAPTRISHKTNDEVSIQWQPIDHAKNRKVAELTVDLELHEQPLGCLVFVVLLMFHNVVSTCPEAQQREQILVNLVEHEVFMEIPCLQKLSPGIIFGVVNHLKATEATETTETNDGLLT